MEAKSMRLTAVLRIMDTHLSWFLLIRVVKAPRVVAPRREKGDPGPGENQPMPK
jgi:hypothetical protein